MSGEGPVLGVVVVVYRSHADTVDFVQRQLPRISCPYRAVVVDVGSTPASTQELAAACGAALASDAPVAEQQLFVLHCAENCGYARGNNQGARFLLAHFPSIRWLLFSNNDIEIVTPDAIDVLIRTLQQRPEVACIGPRVLGLDGRDQSPLYAPVSLGRSICMELLSPPVCRLFLPGGKPHEPREHGLESYCYTVMGCFLLVDAPAFTRVGMFDPQTFLFREEEILSERFLGIARKAYFQPAAVVRHHGGKTIGKYVDDSRVNRLHFESTCYYHRTYRKAGAVRMGLYHVAKRVSLARAALLRRLRGSPAGNAPRPPPTAPSGQAKG